MGMFRTRLDGSELLEFNNKYLSILGLTREESEGKPSSMFWADPKEREEMVKTLKINDRIDNLECRLIRKDGKVIHCVTSLRLYPEQGILEGFIIDITDRKHAEEALRESEEKFRVLFYNEIYAICIIDSETLKLVDVNEAQTHLYGYSRDEMLSGMLSLNLSAETDDSTVSINQILREGSKYIPLRYHRKKDGTIFPVEIVAGKYAWRGRKVIYSIVRDITERKRLEDDLKKNEALLQTAIKNIPLIFYMTDPDGTFRLSIGDGLKGLGLKPNQVVGQSVFDVYRDFPEITTSIKKVLTGESVYFETSVSESTFINFVVPYSFSEREFAGLVGVALDITERKKIEEALKANNTRLEIAMQAAQMAWWEMDMTTGNVIFEKRKAEMLGFPPEKFKHYMDFMALVHPEDQDKAMSAMRGHLDGSFDKYEIEYRILTKSDKYKWFYDIGSIVEKDSKGKPLKVTGLVIDITERKKAEDIIIQSEFVKRVVA